jgi:hypothetical protein
MAALKKFFEAEADVVFINAPHAATGPAYPEVQAFFQPPFYEWWNAVQVRKGYIAMCNVAAMVCS